MPTPKIDPGQLLEHTVNCCNGRVGRELLELAGEHVAIRQFIAPIGIELIKAGQEAGILAKDTVNCCNGRVGRSMMEEVVTALGGS